METVGIVEIETQKEFKPVIFVSEFKGFSPMDDEGVICRFTPFHILHPVVGRTSKGHYLCRDEKIYKRLLDFPGYTKSYKIVKRLPASTSEGGTIITSGVSTADGGMIKIGLSDEHRGMLRELGSIEAKYFTEDSNYKTFKGNIKEGSRDSVIKRVEYIKNELNIDD